MEIVRGAVVKCIAGKDRGRYYVAVEVCGRFVYVCDGKSRKLDNPKKKSQRHISLAGNADMTDMTDKKLRKILFALNNPGWKGEKDDRA